MICEIGSYVGASACCFGAALEISGVGRLVCIDTWRNDAMTEGHRDTFTEFLDNTAHYARYITPVRGLSTQVVGEVRQQAPYLDLLFIDGDHAYAGVKSDWDAYHGFLQKGSIVVFHDYGWADGVRRVIEEEVRPRVSQFDALPNMWWGTIGT